MKELSLLVFQMRAILKKEDGFNSFLIKRTALISIKR